MPLVGRVVMVGGVWQREGEEGLQMLGVPAQYHDHPSATLPNSDINAPGPAPNPKPNRGHQRDVCHLLFPQAKYVWVHH